MVMDGKQRQFRIVANMAATQLEQLGYTVLKTATRSLTFDLIAFNTEHILFISTRRAKAPQSVKQTIHEHHDLVNEMQQTQVPSGAEKQLWIYQNHKGFTVFEFFPNGIMKVTA